MRYIMQVSDDNPTLVNKFNTLQEWLSWQENIHFLSIDLGLARIQHIYEALLVSAKPLTITVGGTNGKGSTVAYLEAFYLAAGYKVGTFTSPHVLRYNERIKINGVPVDDNMICNAFEQINTIRGDTALSYFEFCTLAGLFIFSQANMDIQILEIGLGGRLDAVNIADPDLAIITSIAIDHSEWLGETREAIGREKAGIFRPYIPVIISDPKPPCSMLKIAQEKQTQLFCFGHAYTYYKTDQNTWTWHSLPRNIENLPLPPLKGEHQYRNASSAILAVQCLSQRLPVHDDAIRIGLQNVQLLGRFQLIEHSIPVLLDVAHNPQAAQTLLDHINQYYPNKRIYAIFSMMKDKDIVSVLSLMKPVVMEWFFVPLLKNARAATEPMIASAFKQCNIDSINLGFSNFAEAFSAVNNKATSEDLILVFGSFFLVAECCLTLKIGEIKNGS